MIYTTLGRIRERSPCAAGWSRFTTPETPLRCKLHDGHAESFSTLQRKSQMGTYIYRVTAKTHRCSDWQLTHSLIC